MGDHPAAITTAQALADLFQTHAPGLTGAVRAILGGSAEAGEVLQEAYLKAWRALERGTRPRDAKAWIFVVVMNQARDQARRRRRQPEPHSLAEGEIMEPTCHRPTPVEGLARQEALAAARAAIHDLAEPEREVFLLRTSGGLTFAALAAALGIPVGTAKTRMRAALAHLRHRLDGRERLEMEGRVSS